MTPAWLTGALVAVTFVHVVLLVLVVVRARGLGGAQQVDPSVYHHEEGLECAGCGTLNDAEYRFCRRCVCQLPGQTGFGGSGARPEGRRTL